MLLNDEEEAWQRALHTTMQKLAKMIVEERRLTEFYDTLSIEALEKIVNCMEDD